MPINKMVAAINTAGEPLHNHAADLVVDILKRKKLKKFGAIIADARRRFRLSQADLGCKLWQHEGLTATAAQTRVYRLENGFYELDIETTQRLLNLLGIDKIDPVTLLPLENNDVKRGFVIDCMLFELYPDLHPYLTLLNKNLFRKDFQQVQKIIEAIASYLTCAKPEIENCPTDNNQTSDPTDKNKQASTR